MPPQLKKLSGKDSTELLVYQIGEVKNLLENMTLKFDRYRDDSNLRFIALEKFQAAQMVQDLNQPKIDVQKIILAAFGLISTIVAIALGIKQTQ